MKSAGPWRNRRRAIRNRIDRSAQAVGGSGHMRALGSSRKRVLAGADIREPVAAAAADWQIEIIDPFAQRNRAARHAVKNRFLGARWAVHQLNF